LSVLLTIHGPLANAFSSLPSSAIPSCNGVDLIGMPNRRSTRVMSSRAGCCSVTQARRDTEVHWANRVRLLQFCWLVYSLCDAHSVNGPLSDWAIRCTDTLCILPTRARLNARNTGTQCLLLSWWWALVYGGDGIGVLGSCHALLYLIYGYFNVGNVPYPVSLWLLRGAGLHSIVPRLCYLLRTPSTALLTTISYPNYS
jgi:hypothetical protein